MYRSASDTCSPPQTFTQNSPPNITQLSLRTTMSPPKINSRRPHRKTRAGCRSCKRRKVKCDEAKPVCNNCTKHSLECEFPTMVHHLASVSPTTKRARSISGLVPLTPEPPLDSPGEYINLQDMQLFHNFTTQTYSTIHSDPIQRTMWRVNIPGLACEYDFLMGALLAFSALHLASIHEEKRDFYLALGIRHHELSLRRASMILPDMNDHNCSALYVFAALAALFTIARPPLASDFVVVGDAGIAAWAVMLRGTKSIIDRSESVLSTGPLAPMLISGSRRKQLRSQEELDESTEECVQLKLLQTMIEKSEPDNEKRAIYVAAIDELKRSFLVRYHGAYGFETTDVLIWMFEISAEYLHLLREQTQPALCIFSFFCLMLQQLSGKWWGDGRGHRLMGQIIDLLDEEHRWWIRWPIEQMNWMPMPVQTGVSPQSL